jgi:hypothetical protein
MEQWHPVNETDSTVCSSATYRVDILLWIRGFAVRFVRGTRRLAAAAAAATATGLRRYVQHVRRRQTRLDRCELTRRFAASVTGRAVSQPLLMILKNFAWPCECDVTTGKLGEFHRSAAGNLGTGGDHRWYPLGEAAIAPWRKSLTRRQRRINNVEATSRLAGLLTDESRLL